MSRRHDAGPVLASPVVVTGAASGLGRRLAERWTARGRTVVGIDLDGDTLQGLVARGVVSDAHVVDVRDADEVRRAADRVAEAHGPIRTLVNAAGIVRPGRVDELSPEDVRATIEVNYLGTVHWILSVLPGMQQARTGTIVNFASLAGWMPTPITAAYTASKFAVVGFTEAMAMELAGTGIQVVATCPPAVDTPMLEGIRSHPSIPERITRLAPPLTPDTVIDGIERTLARGELWSFPGVGTTALYRLRRHAPRALRRVSRLLYGL